MEEKTIFCNVPISLIKRTKTGKIQLSVVAKLGDNVVWQKVILTDKQCDELIERLTNV